jgi:hypothetical protein
LHINDENQAQSNATEQENRQIYRPEQVQSDSLVPTSDISLQARTYLKTLGKSKKSEFRIRMNSYQSVMPESISFSKVTH